MAINALMQLPPTARRLIYSVYGLLSLIGVGISAFYGAVPSLTVPDWVTGGLAVLGAIAAPIGVLAASNVDSNPAAPGQVPNQAAAAGATQTAGGTRLAGDLGAPGVASPLTQ